MDVQVVASVATGQQQGPEPQTAPAEAAQPQPPAQGEFQSAPGAQNTGALSPVVANLFAQHGGVAQPADVDVSYRVVHDPNMIVTVFTDPKTGEEIAQVPSEMMIQIAQFFDKQSGVTLDRSA
jgi:uncharacterized FlaG/YvyC family protein